MSITKHRSFDIQIPAYCFFGYKIVKPFFAKVYYSVSIETKEVTINSVQIDFECLKIMSLVTLFFQEIESAANNNSDSLFFDEEIID